MLDAVLNMFLEVLWVKVTNVQSAVNYFAIAMAIPTLRVRKKRNKLECDGTQGCVLVIVKDYLR